MLALLASPSRAALQEAAEQIVSPELARVGALLALSGLAAAPVALRIARRIHPGRQVFFARWGFTHLASVTVAWVLAWLLVASLWPPPEEATLDALLLRSVLVFAAPAALALRYASRLSPEGARALGLHAERNASAVAAGLVSYLLLAPALFGLGFVWPWLIEVLGGEYAYQEVLLRFAAGLSGARLALAVALAVVVQPLLEELLFRGFLQPLLVQNFRDKGGVVLTSLVFAGLHGSGAFLPIFALSLLLGGLMLRTQRLVACWAVHALHNGLTLAVLLTSEELRAALPPHSGGLIP